MKIGKADKNRCKSLGFVTSIAFLKAWNDPSPGHFRFLTFSSSKSVSLLIDPSKCTCNSTLDNGGWIRSSSTTDFGAQIFADILSKTSFSEQTFTLSFNFANEQETFSYRFKVDNIQTIKKLHKLFAKGQSPPLAVRLRRLIENEEFLIRNTIRWDLFWFFKTTENCVRSARGALQEFEKNEKNVVFIMAVFTKFKALNKYKLVRQQK